MTSHTANNSDKKSKGAFSEKDYQSHWDDVYHKSEICELGWYEASPEPSLQLIKDCKLAKDAVLLNVGAGATTLIDELLELGYHNIIVNDISATALEKLKQRLGADAEKVSWVIDDLTHPAELNHLEPVDLWHDRAVLHFFTEKKEQETYFNLLKKSVKSGGFVILATFNLDGAPKCSGLPVHRYDEQMLAVMLGSDFELIKAFDYTYTMPSGEKREYVYTLFKRK